MQIYEQYIYVASDINILFAHLHLLPLFKIPTNRDCSSPKETGTLHHKKTKKNSMEIISINPDAQGVRILGAGGVLFFNEDWMKRKPLPDIKSISKVKQSSKSQPHENK